MSEIERIIESVKKEKERTDKLFQGILFEKRGKEIVMFFEYEEVVDNVSDKHHFIRHNHDPEWVEKKMLPEIKEGLAHLNVTYRCRKDDFI